MEDKKEHMDVGELRESYTMLMEHDTVTRKHRTLRREICFSRIIIIILLITCMATCFFLYILQVRECQINNSSNKEKANESHNEFQTAEQDAHYVQTSLMSSLSIRQRPTLEKANLTWNPYHERLNDFRYKSSDSVNITQDGRYKLSLQIIYSARESNAPPSSLRHLAHRVVLYSDSYRDSQIILNVYESVYPYGTWFKYMFSEVFYIFTLGDVIRVESDNASMIHCSNDWSTKNFLTIQFISAVPEL